MWKNLPQAEKGKARDKAGKAAGVSGRSVDCVIHDGTQRDAVLFSVAANATHGQRRTNADKRKAATTLLLDPEWCVWSDREIAKRCAVSFMLVADVRSSVTMNFHSDAPSRTYTTRHGTVATMATGRIGRRQEAEERADKEDATEVGDDAEDDWGTESTQEAADHSAGFTLVVARARLENAVFAQLAKWPPEAKPSAADLLEQIARELRV
jgi:hypothetical protein